MSLYDNAEYMEDVKYVANLELPWDRLKNKCMMISGATGLIGSFLVDVIFEINKMRKINCKVYLLGRSEEKIRNRFEKYVEDNNFVYIPYDVKLPLETDISEPIDYILHLASNTHPLLYATDPIGTITTNIFGLHHLLEFACNHQAKRFLFASSNEIYGENRKDVELFDENYCGYIDCNTLRAGYPESKRCGEALCQAYKAQKDLDVVIARITRSYGPTMSMSDTKALSQFIIKAINDEDIVLKSEGKQFYSYTYVSDAVGGLLTVLLLGDNGEAYNIADKSGDITLKELAQTIANIKGKRVIYETPSELEASGYSKATKARLSGDKLLKLGWRPKYGIEEGLKRTIEILDTK